MLGLAPMTLDRVGKQVGRVSRERARQMESAVEKRAAAQFQQKRLRPLIDAAASIVQRRGGMVALDKLTKAVLCKGKDGDQLTYLYQNTPLRTPILYSLFSGRRRAPRWR